MPISDKCLVATTQNKREMTKIALGYVLFEIGTAILNLILPYLRENKKKSSCTFFELSRVDCNIMTYYTLPNEFIPEYVSYLLAV